MARYEDADWRESMRIRYDYTHMLADVVGEHRGTTQGQLDEMAGRLTAAIDVLRLRRSPNDLAWMDLPYQKDSIAEILGYAREVEGVYDDVLVLGIGGSALGVTALKSALLPYYANYMSPDVRRHPRLWVLDNVDPGWVMAALRLLDPERTLVIVTSKSGSTTETMAQFLIARGWLQERLGESTACHIVAITDPEQGPLREIAGREGYRTFAVPPGVGGRFSVLSSVGLLPAALVGIDIEELLAGAAYGDELAQAPDLQHNLPGMAAALQHLAYHRGQRISVLMPYSQHLRDLADWWRQLWAESLGKKMSTDGRRLNVGPTPVLALGTTDQHSQIQLYVEGPPDKVISFVAVERFEEEAPLPPARPKEEGIAYLGGHSLAELINAEREATAMALAEAGRPNATYIVPEVNPFTVGQFIYLLEMQTAISGFLYSVNAYDQPGVEAGKVATYALLGRPGYEAQAIELRTTQAARPRHIV
ncbi:MAG TPA: glucose-6-phosphate isomerase [Anaerolineae bacterium]|nr:glucose-6-phosphate isomerase [Anaerolineae bacterium]HPL29841.1 glucose-6-phosphate isomerase [Anaerolineae bacterium]